MNRSPTTRREFEQVHVDNVTDIFTLGGFTAEHVEYTETLHRISWRDRDRSSNHWIEYILDGSDLLVTGDLGSAVYRWYGPPKGWLWKLGGLNLDYFAGKRECVESCDGTQWEPELAKIALREHFTNEDLFDRERFETTSTTEEEILGATDSHHEWTRFLHDDPAEIFDDDWWDWLPSIGEVTKYRIVTHWVGITMAVEQLRKAKR